MKTEKIIRFFFRILKIKIISFLFRIIEIIVVWYYNQTFKKRKEKIDGKFFRIFQLFSFRLHAIQRRKNHEILTEKLDLNSDLDRKVYDLTNKSYVKVSEISPTEVKSAIEYFYNQKIYDVHVPFLDGYPVNLISVNNFLNNKKFNYGSFDIQTSLNCSVVKKICSMKLIWNMAKRYLNTNDVKIYSINTMLTKPSENTNYVDYIHQDLESASCLAFVVFWTDVSKLNGATKIFPGSHLFLYDRRLSNYIGKPLIKYLEDKSGSLFALDTWAYHSGNSNITSPRLVTWIRFTSTPCSTYYRDKHYLFKNNLDEINKDKFL